MPNSKRNYKRKPPVSKKLTKNNSSKDQRREKEVVDTAESVYVSKSNPYAWYANFPNYARDVATVAFGNPLGVPIDIGNKDYITNGGVMAIVFTPTIGVSSNLSSPINRQAIRMYSYLRSVQRSAATYDAADLMMYLVAVSSLYEFWAMCRRAYGVAQLFTPTNAYYPTALLEAMGFNKNIVNNLADFRAFINRFALNIGRFAMPKQFDFLQRHIWMNSGLYLDSNTTRAQTYLFTQHYFYQYNNTGSTGTSLTGVNWDGFNPTPAFNSLSSVQTFAATLLQNMENDEDVLNISGDLYRAYGQDVFSVEETPENYAVLPVYDATVLSQIENLTIAGEFCKIATFETEAPTITQNPTLNNGAILFQPYVFDGYSNISGSTFGKNFPTGNLVTPMNMHMDSPSPEAVMEASRLIAKTVQVGRTGASLTPSALQYCGSEIVNFVRVGVYFSTLNVDWSAVVSNTGWATASGMPSTFVRKLCQFQQFDWAPMLYSAFYGGSDDQIQDVAADVDNFTVLSLDTISNLHQAALLSLLDSPQPIRA